MTLHEPETKKKKKKFDKNDPYYALFVEIRYMDHGLNTEKNESIKILRPGS